MGLIKNIKRNAGRVLLTLALSATLVTGCAARPTEVPEPAHTAIVTYTPSRICHGEPTGTVRHLTGTVTYVKQIHIPYQPNFRSASTIEAEVVYVHNSDGNYVVVSPIPTGYINGSNFDADVKYRPVSVDDIVKATTGKDASEHGYIPGVDGIIVPNK